MVLIDLRNSVQDLGEIARQTYRQGYADTQVRTYARSSLYDPLAYATVLAGTVAGYMGMHHFYEHYVTKAPTWGEWLLHGQGTLLGLLTAGIVAPTIARYAPELMIGAAELAGVLGRMITRKKD